MLSKNALGNLINRYNAVLKKCTLLNVFGSLALAGMIMLGTAVNAEGEHIEVTKKTSTTPGAVYTEYSDDAGGVYEVKDKGILTASGNTFTANHAVTAGGVIFNNGGGKVFFIRGTKFENNYAQSVDTAYSGAIANYDTIEFQGNANFTGNYAQSSGIGDASGGAISNCKTSNIDSKMIFSDNAEFTKNYAQSNGNAYGGAIENSVLLEFKGSAAFSENYAKSSGTGYSQGGAIHNSVVKQGIINFYSAATFTGNHADASGSEKASGGAIENYASIEFYDKAKFNGNYAVSDAGGASGGAFFNNGGGKITFSGDSTFNNNYVLSNGTAYSGAIANYETIKFQGNANFTGNYAQSSGIGDASGGAVSNCKTSNLDSKMIFSKNAQFTKNYVHSNGNAYGGAIENSVLLEFKGNTTFSENYAKSAGTGYAQGGAVHNSVSQQGIINFYSAATFTGNHAQASGSEKASGGAIENYASIGFHDKAKFNGNYAVSDDGGASGGAFFNNGKGKITFSGDSTFKNNYALSNGTAYSGAIANYDTIEFQGNANFTGNYAQSSGIGDASGGAVSNCTAGSSGGSIVFSGNTAFRKNYAAAGGKAYGGAIENYYSIKFLGNTSFTGNYAETTGTTAQGGAVFNGRTGKINFYGTTTFSDNYIKVGGTPTPNDIYNAGTINVTGGTFALTSGYEDTSTGKLNIVNANANIAVSAINGTLTAVQHSKITITSDLSFKSASQFYVDGRTAGSTADTAALKTANTLKVDDGAKLYAEVRNLRSYIVSTSGHLTVSGNGWIGDNLIIKISNILLKDAQYKRDSRSFWIEAKAKDVSEVLPALTPSLIHAVNQLITIDADEDSANYATRFIVRAANRLNSNSAAAAIEGTAKIAFAGAVPQLNLDLAQRTNTALASRDFLSSTPGAGVAAGGTENGFTLWALPVYQYSRGHNFKSGNFHSGYDSNVGGLALGGDYTFNNSLRLGLAVNGGGGKIESAGDYNETKNDINYLGVNAYASWKLNNFSLFAQIGWLRTDNDLNQKTPAVLSMPDSKADTDSNVFTAGLRASYQFSTEWLSLVPYIGLDYYHVSTSGFTVKNSGQDMFHNGAIESDFLQIPVGINMKKVITEAGGWNVKAALDLAVIPTIGNPTASQDIRIQGLTTNVAVTHLITDKCTGRAIVGIEAKKDNFGLGLNYTFQGGSHTINHGVQGMINYKF